MLRNDVGFPTVYRSQDILSQIYDVIQSDVAVAFASAIKLGDNCIQNFHLGRYIIGYTVGNLVLRRRVSGAVKRDFRTYN